MTVSEYNKCVDNFSDCVYRFILKNIKFNNNITNNIDKTKMLESLKRALGILEESVKK